MQIFEGQWFAAFAIGEIIVVYILCTLIGWCKTKTWDVFFEKLYDKIENKYANR